MESEMKRRRFLGSAALFSIVPRHVLGAGFIPPSDKITLAHVGFGTQAIRETAGLLENQELQLTAVCDVEKDGVNYLEWGRNQIRDEIRRLIEPRNLLRSLRFDVGNSRFAQHVLYRRFQAVPDEIAGTD